jgi:flagellar M-ring protein FliF
MDSTAPWPDGLEAGTQESRTGPPSWQRGRTSAQIVFERVSEHIRREPTQSTRLLESWIGGAEDQNPN